MSLDHLSNRDIRKTHKAVISNVESGYPFLKKLKVPAWAIKGKEDYVPDLKTIETEVVDGKHTTPLEQPERVFELITQMVK